MVIIQKIKRIFNTTSSFNKMKQELMVFFQEIIYQKKIKYGAYVINLDEYEDIGTNWIALFCKKMKLLILILLELNIFLKKLKNLLVIER